MNSKLFSYFPGCSLATTAKENNASLYNITDVLGFKLEELKDWNCCGSSSAHCIDGNLADQLAMRNLSLAPAGRPLLVACPSCNLRLQQANLKLKMNPSARLQYKELFGCSPDLDLEILHFFEMLERVDWQSFSSLRTNSLKKLKFAPYYGCMLARPPSLRKMKNYHGLMEKILSSLGAAPVTWAYGSRCCGTFLSVVRPDIVTKMVHDIVNDAKLSGADCLVTACAMCHMNLEIRSDQNQALPIFHFSEILSLAFEQQDVDTYFARHLIDPRPLLNRCQLIPSISANQST